MSHIVMARTVMAYIVMAYEQERAADQCESTHVVMACLVMACRVMAYDRSGLLIDANPLVFGEMVLKDRNAVWSIVLKHH